MRGLSNRMAMMAKSGVGPGPVPYDSKVEYISFHGDEYIDTLINYAETSRIVFEFRPEYDPEVSSWSQDFFGCCYGDDGLGARCRRMEDSNEQCDICIYHCWGQPFINYGEFNSFDLSNGCWLINGEYFEPYGVMATIQSLNFWIGCCNLNGRPYRKAPMDFKSMITYDLDGEECGRLIAVRVGSVGYIYDEINGNLCGNGSGMGEITPGNDIN